MSKDKDELLKRAFFESVENKVRDTEEKLNNIESPKHSRRYKRRMNRFFRECVGGFFIPFPEADNLYEKLRSRLIVKLKTTVFQNRATGD